MPRLAFLGLILAGACQPMYGAKPAKLSRLEPVHHMVTETPPPTVKYIEECRADFQVDAKRIGLVPQPKIAKTLTDAGNAALDSADKAADDHAKVGLLTDAIREYSNALVKDPYDPEATLELARAYDRVLRKGCALAMLGRLGKLSNHPAFAKQANLTIARIDDNAGWFRGYRKDALAAVGH